MGHGCMEVKEMLSQHNKSDLSGLTPARLDETRRVTEAAGQAKVATQLGNQGQADKAARVTIELIEAGAIGPVHEVQVWSGPRFWGHASWEGRPPETPAVPDGMDGDLWLGPAPQRPYHPAYHPWSWRNWWDFGTGLLGDLGCHKLSTVCKALNLGHPATVEASSTKLNPETYPVGVLGHSTRLSGGRSPLCPERPPAATCQPFRLALEPRNFPDTRFGGTPIVERPERPVFSAPANMQFT
jgi:hypothetical protein